jgi:collagenase-like PrtC family protease
MAKAKITKTDNSILVLEASVYLSSRGRSVATGTLLIDGEMKTFKHELDSTEKSDVSSLILSVVTLTPKDQV